MLADTFATRRGVATDCDRNPGHCTIRKKETPVRNFGILLCTYSGSLILNCSECRIRHPGTARCFVLPFKFALFNQRHVRRHADVANTTLVQNLQLN